MQTQALSCAIQRRVLVAAMDTSASHRVATRKQEGLNAKNKSLGYEVS